MLTSQTVRCIRWMASAKRPRYLLLIWFPPNTPLPLFVGITRAGIVNFFVFIVFALFSNMVIMITSQGVDWSLNAFAAPFARSNAIEQTDYA